MTGNAAVIGGGIGGLAAAAILQRAGWSVRVHERAGTLGGAGTALGMWPEALRALDALGIGAEVRRIGAPQRTGEFRRPDGRRIATIDVAALVRRTGDTVHLISRPALLRLLAGALSPGTVTFDSEVTSVSDLVDDHDVVIAADGIFGRSRGQLFGAAGAPRYAGVTAWRGTVPGATSAVTETWGPGRRFGITPREDGRTNWYASLRTPAGGRAPGGEVTLLRALFGDWHDEVRRVLAGIREEEVLRHDLYHLAPPLPSYVAGSVALIGDAAHAMTPDLGRGACEALVDAVTLGRCLIDEPAVAVALARYDRARRRPTQRLARVSHLVGRLAQARRWTGARNAAVRLALAAGPPN
ncbi:FAD-dependent monooxygenase [Solwaraspora sp. WMMD1047]|uniref:FAD-dependent monooxygenase n=1 Tax=Solwaraspora sp. WMMD1047 TaxID=3016102 RepID=UPI002416F29A|nr:FAD-dependent monooxygenase [Solwaraspora sp. WMMD1047]MDG4832484.1 FAD-dependent monooxygenase [Solwaraspora sp. WMMD1047]